MYSDRLSSAELLPKVFHMYRSDPRHQLPFEDFFLPFAGKLSGDNRWIKLDELILWKDLEDEYASQFCKGLEHRQKPSAWRWVH
jgi:IS5 family transposase